MHYTPEPGPLDSPPHRRWECARFSVPRDKEMWMRSRCLLAALACWFLLGLSPLAAAPLVEHAILLVSTRADGKTFYDFANNPIPAGFFCKSSKPFNGRV